MNSRFHSQVIGGGLVIMDNRRLNRILKGSNLLVACCLLAGLTHANVPGLISYQGQLNDDSGTPVNGTVAMAFSIYDVASGGTALWTENQDVTVSNGVFNVQLGVVQTIPSYLFNNAELYLGIKVGADAEMTPRQRLTSSAYSQRSEVIMPIGSIVAWNKGMPGTPALSDGWVECNGQVLADPESPYDGATVPDLNGNGGPGRFLRGQATSGGTGGSETHTHEINPGNTTVWSNGVSTYGSPTAPTSTLPSYYEVVWIMRVK